MTRLTIRTTAAATIAAALALAAPFASPAAAAKNQGGGPPQVTCEGFGGGKPGEKVTVTNYVRHRGKVIWESKTTYICGEDGAWHTVLA